MATATTKQPASAQSAGSLTPEQQLAAAHAEAERVAALKKQAETAKADLERALEEMRQRAIEAEQEAQKAAEAEELAQRRIRDAERQILPAPIDAAEARMIAERLIAAFDAYRSRHSDGDDDLDAITGTIAKRNATKTARSNEQAALKLWDDIDDTTARMLTPEITDDARSIVLAIEGVLDAVSEWEAARVKELAPEVERLRKELGKTVDPRAEISPADSRLVSRLLAELADVLAGRQPARKVESAGELFHQNIAPAQIARMLGMEQTDGVGDIARLGYTIDRALARAGYFSEIAGISHLTRMGALNQDDAWAIREQGLQRRRDRAWETGRAGSIQSTGQYRPGRDARSLSDRATGSLETHELEMTPAFHASLQQIAQRRRAAAVQAAAAPVDEPADEQEPLTRF